MALIEINGKKFEAETGTMIIEIADHNHIQIPRFCYHKKLSIAANCRMCLVEVEKAPKPLPACATPVTEGMKIWTHSPKVLQAQKSVMEFLLINHPLDCPICDQGGECELQDLSMGYGSDTSRYSEGKRTVKDKNLGPLIATDMTRCIHCTRCVRFGSEVAGIREMGGTGRGECTEIGTYIEQTVHSEVSGNIIDLCPVGALTSKPFRFTARGWELKQTMSIAPHDAMGSNIHLQTRRGEVMRVVPKENEAINEVWISDRDRYSYEGLLAEDRLLEPKIKKEGRWVTSTWMEALDYVVHQFKKGLSQFGPSQLGGVISPNATLEESYLFQKLLRGLGVVAIDHRLRQSDFRGQENMPKFPQLGISLKEIESQETILLVGTNLRKELPLLAVKLRKMVQMGGKVCVINPVDFEFNFDLAGKAILSGGDLVLGLARVLKTIDPKNHLLADITPEKSDFEMANLLLKKEKKCLLLGALAISHPHFSELMVLANRMSELTGAKIGLLSDGANAAGAWLTGCVPHRLPGGVPLEAGKNYSIADMWDKPLKNYVLLNVEPDLDCLNGRETMNALKGADFVLAISPYESHALLSIAHVLLPLSVFSENSGTFVNCEGQWQSFEPAVMPAGESRPAWKILQVLGNLLEQKDFDYETVTEVKSALIRESNEQLGISVAGYASHWSPKHLNVMNHGNKLIRIAPVPLYASDSLVRRAKSLQQMRDKGDNMMYLNANMAEKFKLTGTKAEIQSEKNRFILSFRIDERIPDNSVLIDASLPETVSLGAPYGVLHIESV